MEWKSSNEKPQLHTIVSITANNGEDEYKYECCRSDMAIIYKDGRFMLAAYYKSTSGFDEWQEVENGLRIEPPLYWMQLTKPPKEV